MEGRWKALQASGLARVVSGMSQLLEADHIALGTDEMPVNHPRDPEAELSDEELYKKVQQMLERQPARPIQ